MNMPKKYHRQGQGSTWNLTPDRRVTVIDMLKKQHSVASIADYFEITPNTLRKKIKEAGIDHKQVRQIGLVGLRRAAYDMLMSMDTDMDDKEKFNALMKYLDRYERDEELEPRAEQDSGSIDINVAINKVMNDLQQ
jgi:hypothetical protein